MRTSYRSDDVTVLLKDITGQIQPMETEERERRIQSGMHYSQMLPLEYQPSPQYLSEYANGLIRYARMTAAAVILTAQKIFAEKGKGAVLVSLARAGTPIGILIRRYLQRQYGVQAPHYTISIIRGRGIDGNAMRYLLGRYTPQQLQFVDGWTGKGAILNTLEQELAAYPGVSAELAVLADPAGITKLCGTHEDFLVPSCCLNASVSGLMSRTVLREDLIGPGEFHGAVYYEELKDLDQSYGFIDAIEAEIRELSEKRTPQQAAQQAEAVFASAGRMEGSGTGMEEVREIAKAFDISDLNLIKPGIGETTRVLLRRVPELILVHDLRDQKYLSHIYRLAEEKGVTVKEYSLRRYRACGLIRRMAADL